MKVSELIAELQKRHPDATVEVYMHPSFSSMPNVEGYEYALISLEGVGDWGNPGEADDLVTINAGHVTGA